MKVAFSPLGTDILPWLGKMSSMSPIGDFSDPPYGENDEKSPFPVRPADRRSYTQNCVVWIKNTGLQVGMRSLGCVKMA